jgi:hypothetical protein
MDIGFPQSEILATQLLSRIREHIKDPLEDQWISFRIRAVMDAVAKESKVSPKALH